MLGLPKVVMPTLQKLFIYPIKSLGGIEQNKALALKAGFENDRRWMLVDDQNMFITQRDIRELTQFVPSIQDNVISVRYQNETIEWEIVRTEKETINTKVWDDAAITVGVDTRIDTWFSDMLERKVRLVKLKDDKSRTHINSNGGQRLQVSLADGYPYLIVSEESIELLNKALELPVSLMHFRPNIVVEAQVPHEEDLWTELRTPHTTFVNVKPCARCQVINIDPKTGLISKEPSKTLSTYRKQGNKILFGSLYKCTKQGVLEVGDEFYIGAENVI